MKTSINPNSAIIKPWNIADNLPDQYEPESLAEKLPEDNISENLPENINPEDLQGYINPEDIEESPYIGSETFPDGRIDFSYLQNPELQKLKERLGLNIE